MPTTAAELYVIQAFKLLSSTAHCALKYGKNMCYQTAMPIYNMYYSIAIRLQPLRIYMTTSSTCAQVC